MNCFSSCYQELTPISLQGKQSATTPICIPNAVHILKGTFSYKNIQTNKESKPVTLTDLIEVVGVCDLVVKELKEPDTVVSAENDPIKDGLCGV